MGRRRQGQAGRSAGRSLRLHRPLSGRHNAGHTILIGDRKFVLRLVPSGILHPGKIAVIGNGLVVDPIALLEEVEQCWAAGVDVEATAHQQPRAGSAAFAPAGGKITEAIRAESPIGTTRAASAPATKTRPRGAESAWRILLDREYFRRSARALMEDHRTRARAFGIDDDDRFEGRSSRGMPRRRSASGRWFAIRRACSPTPCRGEEPPVRRRAGHHARSRSRHLSVCDLVQRVGGRRVHRHGRAADEDRRRDRHFEGLHHARGRRAVSHGSARCGGRSDPQSRATNSAR
jgi:hypothetical protein